MTNRVVLNETSYFGRGAREKVVEEIKGRGFKKVLLVIMNESKKNEYVQLNIDKNNQYYFNLEPHSILNFIV